MKMEARGMFKGAKVVRGPDWEWRDQDGGPNMEGVVTEVTRWDEKSLRDAVRVTWKEGQRSNIYRLGRNGKVSFRITSLSACVVDTNKTVNYQLAWSLVFFNLTGRWVHKSFHPSWCRILSV